MKVIRNVGGWTATGNCIGFAERNGVDIFPADEWGEYESNALRHVVPYTPVRTMQMCVFV